MIVKVKDKVDRPSTGRFMNESGEGVDTDKRGVLMERKIRMDKALSQNTTMTKI
jgi:hypothetical protein